MGPHNFGKYTTRLPRKSSSWLSVPGLRRGRLPRGLLGILGDDSFRKVGLPWRGFKKGVALRKAAGRMYTYIYMCVNTYVSIYAYIDTPKVTHIASICR